MGNLIQLRIIDVVKTSFWKIVSVPFLLVQLTQEVTSTDLIFTFSTCPCLLAGKGANKQ